METKYEVNSELDSNLLRKLDDADLVDLLEVCSINLNQRKQMAGELLTAESIFEKIMSPFEAATVIGKKVNLATFYELDDETLFKCIQHKCNLCAPE